MDQSSEQQSDEATLRLAESCRNSTPTTEELFSNLPTEGYVLVGILSLFTFLTIVIFVEEISFFCKYFRQPSRTILVLACFPVFSLTALLGVVIPKSGTVVDLIANGFFGTCMYNFGRLMSTYMGGQRRMWLDMKPHRTMSFNALPCCCCCLCLPKARLQESNYNRVQWLIIQVAFVRPLLSLVAVALWTNGSYNPGRFDARNPHVYMTVINIASTMLAVYGLMVTKVTLSPDLGISHRISGKIFSVQLALVSTILSNVIIGILVYNDVIKCGPLFPSRTRGEEIYHCVVVLLMLPFGLVGQRFFRSESDDLSLPERKGATLVASLCSSATAKNSQSNQTPGETVI